MHSPRGPQTALQGLANRKIPAIPQAYRDAGQIIAPIYFPVSGLVAVKSALHPNLKIVPSR